MLLSETKVRKAIIKQKLYKLKDGEGLYLIIHPNGSKYWRMRYTFLGKERMLAIGKYPHISLQKAREERGAAQRLLAEGIDPVNARKVKKCTDNSFQTVALEWHDKNLAKWSPEYGVTVKRRLEKYIFPHYGAVGIDKIKPLNLLHCLQVAQADGKIDTAHRVLQICKSVFGYAIVTGRLEYNPAQDLSKALTVYKSKKYPTIKFEGLKALLKALNAVGESRILVTLATKIQLLVFLRSTELRSGEWTHVNWNEEVWVIPDKNMKMKREHIVPLAPQTIRLLKELHKITGKGKYMFPNRVNGKYPIMSENAVNKLLKEIKYGGILVAHGFRALASTHLNESGLFAEKAIEKQLAHEEGNKVKAAYNRAEYLDERKRIMIWWANQVETCGVL